MPPFGLYPMPRNHLYGGRVKPKVFNTNDFQEDRDQPATPDSAALATMDGAADGHQHALSELEEAKKAKKMKKKKEKKRQSLNDEKNSALERILAQAEATPDDAESKAKNKKKKKKHRKSGDGGREDSQLATKAQNDEKAKGSDIVQESTSAKKDTKHKKAEGGDIIQEHACAKKAAMKMKHGNPSQERMSAAKESKNKKVEDVNITRERSSTNDKKDKKSGTNGATKKRKRESVGQAESATNNDSRVNDYLADPTLPAEVVALLRNADSPTKQLQSQQATEQLSKKKTKRKSQTAILPDEQNANANKQTLQVNASGKQKAKKPRQNADDVGQADTPATPTPIRGSKELPISASQMLQKSAFSPTDKLQHKKATEDVLVPETPPSKFTQKQDITLPGGLGNGAATTADRKQSKKESRFIYVSTPTSSDEAPFPATAPAALTRSDAASTLPSVHNALTDANLRTLKAPLKEESKPRPQLKRALSTATSGQESSVSLTIPAAFARVGKPYSRSAVDAFVTKSTKEKQRKNHEEAPLDVFNERYRELKQAVNFDEEREYLQAELDWDTEHNQQPLPCMGNLTGCSAKKDQLLRIAQEEENMDALAHLDIDEKDSAKLAEAHREGQLAEDLLMLATRAEIPVPVGHIEGMWTLYCPAYAQSHVDRYGYGKRTLNISSIAGFRYKNSFTARLHMLPRTMSYTILAFQTPPHASFRVINTKTAAESYPVSMVFLGNGYMHLRVDLKLVLTGRENAEKYAMEFIGIHEKAVKWCPDDQDDLKVIGKKFFAKYD